MCAYAEARTHDPKIKSQTPIPLSYRGHCYCSLVKFCHSTVKFQYLEVDGTIFYKFKLPKVQINLHLG